MTHTFKTKSIDVILYGALKYFNLAEVEVSDQELTYQVEWELREWGVKSAVRWVVELKIDLIGELDKERGLVWKYGSCFIEAQPQDDWMLEFLTEFEDDGAFAPEEIIIDFDKKTIEIA